MTNIYDPGSQWGVRIGTLGDAATKEFAMSIEVDGIARAVPAAFLFQVDQVMRGLLEEGWTSPLDVSKFQRALSANADVSLPPVLGSDFHHPPV